MMDAIPDKDIESQLEAPLLQEEALLQEGSRWRVLSRVLQALSYLNSLVLKDAEKASLALQGVPSPTNSNNTNTNTEDGGMDIESQEPLLATPHRKNRWRVISLILHVQRFLNFLVQEAKQIDSAPTSSSEDGVSAPLHVTDSELKGSLDVHLPNITEIVEKEDFARLRRFGGIQKVAEALSTNLDTGIPSNEEDLRVRNIASRQTATQAPPQAFIHYLVKNCNNCIILLLLLSAILSFAYGIIEKGSSTGWYEGAIIFVAIIILVVAPAIRDYYLENLQMSKMQQSDKHSNTEVEVIRAGLVCHINISEIVIGDVICLKRRQQIPVDGLFISGELTVLKDGLMTTIDNYNPFVFFGSKIVKGSCRMVVTSVGANTLWGKMMRSTNKLGNTPLQGQFDKVITSTQIIGLLIPVVMLISNILRLELLREKHSAGFPETKGKPIPLMKLEKAFELFDFKSNGEMGRITGLLTVLVGVVEGFPSLVTLAIIYWRRKALSDNASARQSSVCVSMGSVTTIITDITGCLTLKEWEVDVCYIGEEYICEDTVVATHVEEALGEGISMPVLPLGSSGTTLKFGPEVLNLSKETVVEKEISKDGTGNRTLCSYWTGPAEKILKKCSHHYDISGRTNDMDSEKRNRIQQTIQNMESRNLKTVAFAFADNQSNTGHVLQENNLTLVGMVGLKKKCWEKIKKVMRAYQNAGVGIKLVSSNEVSALVNIAHQCGMSIPDTDEAKVKGEVFRNWTDQQRKDNADKICVIGNATSSDRLLLVKCLRGKGQKVAVVGSTIHESPALKEADVGIAMGSWNSRMTTESADIIIWDKDLGSLRPILEYGRCTYENIRKYIQLEVTMFISGLLVTLITTASSGKSPITTFQLIWINMIMTSFGGLALLTEPPSEILMQKQPIGGTNRLISNAMWRSIITQVLYQTAASLIIHFKGQALLRTDNKEKVSNTIVFHSFALCQVFNLLNAREPEVKNVLTGILHHLRSWEAAFGVLFALQEAFIEVAHSLVDNARLNRIQWGICFIIASLSLPVELVSKCACEFVINMRRKCMAHSAVEPVSRVELPPINPNNMSDINDGSLAPADNDEIPHVSNDPSDCPDRDQDAVMENGSTAIPS